MSARVLAVGAALALGLSGSPRPASAGQAADRPAAAIDCDAFALGLDGAWTVRRRTVVRKGAAVREVAPGERFDGPEADAGGVDVAGLLRDRCGGLF